MDVDLEWLSLGVVGFLCGLFLGPLLGTIVFVLLVAAVATYVISTTPEGGQLVLIVLTFGAGVVLVLGGGGLAAGSLLRHPAAAVAQSGPGPRAGDAFGQPALAAWPS